MVTFASRAHTPTMNFALRIIRRWFVSKEMGMYFLLALGLPGGLGSEDMGGGGAYEGGGLARAFDKGGMAEGVCGTANTFI